METSGETPKVLRTSQGNKAGFVGEADPGRTDDRVQMPGKTRLILRHTYTHTMQDTHRHRHTHMLTE